MQEDKAYHLIDSLDAMSAAMEKLAGASELALDLEMENHYHHYGLHIALVQVSIRNSKPFVFDPLSGIDLTPLGTMLTDPGVELSIHDADFDKRACRQIYKWNLNNFFDTKVAAQFCGFKQYGLGNLLANLLNVKTDKKFQRIDWLKRPLRKDALDYAAGETRFLFDIRDILEKRLSELDRLSWAREEFKRLETFEDPHDCAASHLRIKGSSTLTSRQLAVLGELAGFRDKIARKTGRPVHFVISNKTLLEMAALPPRTAEELNKIRGLHPAVYRASNVALLIETINRGMSGPTETHPRREQRPRSTPGYGNRLKAMQKWRAQIAEELDIEPHLLLSNDILGWCARNAEKSLPDDVSSQIRNWQRQLLWNDFRTRFSVADRDSAGTAKSG